MRTTMLAGLAAAAILAAACSAGTTSGGQNPATQTTTAAPTTVAIGQTINLDVSILGTHTKTQVTVANLKLGVRGSSVVKPANGQFIVADVTVIAVEGKTMLSAGSFKFVAPDNTVYEPAYLVPGVALLATAELSPPQKAAGKIAFDVPARNLTGSKIALTNFLADGDAGYWTI